MTAIASCASVSGLPVCGLGTPGMTADSLSLLVRITDITAAPIELPICWRMFTKVEPRATSWLVSVFSAEVSHRTGNYLNLDIIAVNGEPPVTR